MTTPHDDRAHGYRTTILLPDRQRLDIHVPGGTGCGGGMAPGGRLFIQMLDEAQRPKRLLFREHLSSLAHLDGLARVVAALRLDEEGCREEARPLLQRIPRHWRHLATLLGGR